MADSPSAFSEKIKKYLTLKKEWGLKYFIFDVTSWAVLRWLIVALIGAPMVYFLNQRIGSSTDNLVQGITFSASDPKKIQFPWIIADIELDNMAAVDFQCANRACSAYILTLTIAEREYYDGVFIFHRETSYFQRLKLIVFPHTETKRLFFGGKLYYFRIYAETKIPKDKLVKAINLLNKYPPDLKGFCGLGLSHLQKAMLLLRYMPGAKLRAGIMPDIKPTTASYVTGRDKNGKIVFAAYAKIESIYNKNIVIVSPKSCE